MARKRTELRAATEARIVALMRAGGTAESIAKQLGSKGCKASRATIGRRMAELAGKVNGARAGLLAKEPPPLPESPDAIPEGTDLDTINAWLETAKRMGKVAEVEGDLD